MARESVGGGGARDDATGEQPIEIRRHLDAVWRSRVPIAAFVVIVTVATYLVSASMAKSYQATARLLYDATANPLADQSSDGVTRQLATYEALLVTPSILVKVGQKVGVTESQLEQDVTGTVDATANLLDVTAKAGTAAKAQSIANTVASTFVAAQSASQLAQLTSASARLRVQLAQLRAAGGSATEVQALENRLSDIVVSASGSNAQLQLVEPAQLPPGATSPRPTRNALVAFFAGIFLGVLLALARDQFTPRIAGARELTRITDWPALASIPFVRRRFGRQPPVLSAAEYEAYQTLQATLRFQLMPGQSHVLLVTSAREGEGKTTVVSNVARSLGRAQRKTLVVSADMRKPTLHTMLGVDRAPGLAEVLVALERDDVPTSRTLAALRGLLEAQTAHKGYLHVLPSGAPTEDAARLLMSGGMPTLLEALRAMEYEYVIIDGTPLLGLADSQSLAQRVDEVIVVSRLDRLRTDDVLEMRDVLDRLDVTPLGHVVIGGRRQASSYYQQSPTELQTA